MIRFIKSFFYSRGRPAPVYFWATIFCSLAAAMMILKLIGRSDISDALIGIVLGFVLGWVGLYNLQKNGENHDKQN